jgi:hypothetical protein
MPVLLEVELAVRADAVDVEYEEADAGRVAEDVLIGGSAGEKRSVLSRHGILEVLG